MKTKSTKTVAREHGESVLSLMNFVRRGKCQRPAFDEYGCFAWTPADVRSLQKAIAARNAKRGRVAKRKAAAK